jgi:murein DD-endopeptidase MepM/ murein hydrolase activator NlpD
MGVPREARVVHPHPQADAGGGHRAEVIPLRPRREPLAERLERERLERERRERERRARIERDRAARDRAVKERIERRRRDRLEQLRRQRAELRRRRRPRAAEAPAGPPPASSKARIEPRVEGPVVRERPRAQRGLFWPTAKAGLAITVVLGLSAALGSLLGLPVPGLDAQAGRGTLAASAASFGIDPGTPPGLADGYVFPILGAHDFGGADARFGASRYGHVHEGQDIFGKTGTPEVAVHDGVIVDRGRNRGRYSGGRGNYLVIYSPEDDHSFVYMHMLRPSPLQLGDHVHAGQVVGRLGCSGSCEGPHLHFEVRIGRASLRSDTKPVDPLPYLRQWPEPTPG